MGKVRWTDEAIFNEISRMVAGGMTSLDIRNENNSLHTTVTRRFSGIKRYCELNGLEFNRRKKAVKNLKYTDEVIDAFIKSLPEIYENYSLNWFKQNKEHVGLVHAVCRRYGTWNKALLSNGITPVMNMTAGMSAEDVKRRYLEDFRNGVNRSDINYVVSIRKFFGSFDALDAELGIERKRKESILYDKPTLDAKIYEILRDSTVDMISADYLNAIDENLAYSIRHHFGSVLEYFTELDGVDYYTKPRVPFRWTPENTKRQLLRWVSDGVPVNYTAVAQSHGGILTASRKFYGGWEQLFEACGLKYDDYRVDTDMASYYGRQFEEIVGEIFTDCGMGYTKYDVEAPCHPDFVIGGHWIDAKLSQWTISMADNNTVKKYEPHCDALTIVFLRGDRDIDKMISGKTRLVSIYFYVSQLGDEKQRYYLRKLDDIERNISEGVRKGVDEEPVKITAPKTIKHYNHATRGDGDFGCWLT